MDIAPTILLATVLWQVIDLFREAAGKQWSAVTTQAIAFAGGVLVVVLAAHAALFDQFTVNGLTLTALDGGSQVFLGLGIAALASTGVDIKQALDGKDDASKPPLIGP